MGRFKDDLMFMVLTEIFSRQSHCQRIKVAALIVKDGRILSVGYNGTPKGLINCDEVFSEEDIQKEDFKTRHHEWSDIHELHAEQNAISWAAKIGISLEGATIYVRYSPCRHCSKLIIASGIKRVVFLEKYDRDQEGLKLMQSAGISLDQIDIKEYEKFKKKLISEIL